MVKHLLFSIGEILRPIIGQGRQTNPGEVPLTQSQGLASRSQTQDKTVPGLGRLSTGCPGCHALSRTRIRFYQPTHSFPSQRSPSAVWDSSESSDWNQPATLPRSGAIRATSLPHPRRPTFWKPQRLAIQVCARPSFSFHPLSDRHRRRGAHIHCPQLGDPLARWLRWRLASRVPHAPCWLRGG